MMTNHRGLGIASVLDISSDIGTQAIRLLMSEGKQILLDGR
jgi:hypothetical protein